MEITEWLRDRGRDTSRAVRRKPLFYGIIILLFGVTAAVNTISFTLLDRIVLQATPFPSPTELAMVSCRTTAFRIPGGCSLPVISELRRQSSAVQDIAYYRTTGAHATSGADTFDLATALVSSSFFRTFGVWPQLGRWFIASDEHSGDGHLVILSQHLWRTRFNGQRRIVGQSILLDGAPYRVLGVMPGQFAFPTPSVEAWILDPLTPEEMQQDGLWQSQVVVRLKADQDLRRARAEMSVVAAHIGSNSGANSGLGFEVIPLRQAILGKSAGAIWILYTLTWLFLVLIVANLVNLSIANQANQERQRALKQALGADPWRIVCEEIFHYCLIAIPTLLVVYACVYAGVAWLSALSEMDLPRWQMLGTNLQTALYAGAVTILLCVGTGVLSVVITPSRVLSTFGAGADSIASEMRIKRRSPIESTLIVLQICAAEVLMIYAFSQAGNLIRILNINLGFNANRLAGVMLHPRPSTKSDAPDYEATDAASTIQRSPNIAGAAVASSNLLNAAANMVQVHFISPMSNRPSGAMVYFNPVSSNFFDVIKAKFSSGRAFTPIEEAGPRCVVVINAAFASTTGLVPGAQLSLFNMDLMRWDNCTILGIVGTRRTISLDEDDKGEVFAAFLQWPQTNATLIVRGPHASHWLQQVRAVVAQNATSRGIMAIVPFDERIDNHSLKPKLMAYQSMLMSGTAYVVAIIGAFALAACFTQRRQRELCLRRSFGAGGIHLIILAGKRICLAGVIGIFLGALFAIAANQVLRDPVVAIPIVTIGECVCAGSILMVAVILACAAPIVMTLKRAPAEVLRVE